MDEERKLMSAWIQDVKNSCDREKKHMEERICALLREQEAHVLDGGGAPERSAHVPTERPEDGSSEYALSDPPADPGGGGGGGDGGGAGDVALSSNTTVPSTEGAPHPAAMVKTLTSFLQAQAEAMAAHARSTAVQQLSALPLYTAEKK